MKKLGIICIILCIAIVAFIHYRSSTFYSKTREFSGYTLLSSSWEKYKEEFISNDGRVIDHSQNEMTTSEGQSYALLRAVWSDDRQTFDKVLNWTQTNMKRPDDSLYSWRWGKRADASYGPLENGGINSATDADQDIALALLMASKRWNEKSYYTDATTIIDDIWLNETAVADGKRYITAGNWANDQERIIVNPSYFAPYAWRIFAKVDKHDWNSLITPAYTLLVTSGKDKLDSDKGVGLPPDWVAINKDTGVVTATNLPNLTTSYSYDAIRIPWRIALDYLWNKDPQAKAYLGSLDILDDLYQKDNKLYASYTHNGLPLQTFESPAQYSTALAYFLVENPERAKDIYENKIIKLYSNNENAFRNDITYYEQNWLWFGAAMYNNRLVPYIK